MKNKIIHINKQHKFSYELVTILILIAILVFSILISITFGSIKLTIKDVYSVIIYSIFHIEKFNNFSSGPIHNVVWLIRFPRILMAICVGASLSVCGTVMQAIVKNPLADPYILGISSGASLGATLAIVLGFGAMFGSNSVGILAFAGALIASFVVILISNIGGRSSSAKLVLTGVALAAVFSAVASLILYVYNNKNAMQEVIYWTMGSLSNSNWTNIIALLPIVIIGTLFFCTQYRVLNLMLLGDEVSITLGLDLFKWRILYLIVASILIGFSVFSSGIIGFVGLIIPHITRTIFGTDHKITLPVSALIGAIFTIWADVLCRIIIPDSEIPIGILVSLIGAPLFIYLMISKTYGIGGTNDAFKN